MKILYLDCQAGISGDMTVGALLDLGVPLEYLRSELDRLELQSGSYELSVSRTERQQVSALKFDVAVNDHHTHRHYAGIDTMIAGSGLVEPVKERARLIFRRLAEAELRQHQDGHRRQKAGHQHEREHDGQTRMTTQAVFQSVEDRDGMIQSGMEHGENESVERLDEVLAKLKV